MKRAKKRAFVKKVVERSADRGPVKVSKNKFDCTLGYPGEGPCEDDCYCKGVLHLDHSLTSAKVHSQCDGPLRMAIFIARENNWPLEDVKIEYVFGTLVMDFPLWFGYDGTMFMIRPELYHYWQQAEMKFNSSLGFPGEGPEVEITVRPHCEKTEGCTKHYHEVVRKAGAPRRQAQVAKLRRKTHKIPLEVCAAPTPYNCLFRGADGSAVPWHHWHYTDADALIEAKEAAATADKAEKPGALNISMFANAEDYFQQDNLTKKQLRVKIPSSLFLNQWGSNASNSPASAVVPMGYEQKERKGGETTLPQIPLERGVGQQAGGHDDVVKENKYKAVVQGSAEFKGTVFRQSLPPNSFGLASRSLAHDHKHARGPDGKDDDWGVESSGDDEPESPSAPEVIRLSFSELRLIEEAKWNEAGGDGVGGDLDPAGDEDSEAELDPATAAIIDEHNRVVELNRVRECRRVEVLRECNPNSSVLREGPSMVSRCRAFGEHGKARRFVKRRDMSRGIAHIVRRFVDLHPHTRFNVPPVPMHQPLLNIVPRPLTAGLLPHVRGQEEERQPVACYRVVVDEGGVARPLLVRDPAYEFIGDVGPLFWRDLHYNAIVVDVRSTVREKIGRWLDEKFCHVPFTGRDENYEPHPDERCSYELNNPEVVSVKSRSKRTWGWRRKVLNEAKKKDVAYAKALKERRQGYVSAIVVEALMAEELITRTQAVISSGAGFKINPNLMSAMLSLCSRDYASKDGSIGTVMRVLKMGSFVTNPEECLRKRRLLGNSCLFVLNHLVRLSLGENVRASGDTETPDFGGQAR
jgi:hypothetical protein